MGRIGCNIGETDNALGIEYGDEPTLAEMQAHMGATARYQAEEHERFRRNVAEKMLEMLKSGRYGRVHPPVPKGVWR